MNIIDNSAHTQKKTTLVMQRWYERTADRMAPQMEALPGFLA